MARNRERGPDVLLSRIRLWSADGAVQKETDLSTGLSMHSHGLFASKLDLFISVANSGTLLLLLLLLETAAAAIAVVAAVAVRNSCCCCLRWVAEYGSDMEGRGIQSMSGSRPINHPENQSREVAERTSRTTK